MTESPSPSDASTPPRQPLPEARFPVVRRRAGYDRAEVDAFVAGVRTALAEDPPGMAPYEIDDARFHAHWWRGGYDLRAVDDYLEAARLALVERHGADAVAGVHGHTSPPRHVPTWWIYALAGIVIAVVVVAVATRL